METIHPKSLNFLKQLAQNNNRDWFQSHKTEYITAQSNIIEFADELIALLNQHDDIETPSGKSSLFRIYRDVRFAKDKSPYSPQWFGGFRRATKKLRGGYYYQIEPNNSFVACAFWGPAKEDLQRIREDIDLNHDKWYEIIHSKSFKTNFGKLQGDTLKTAPRGYDVNHPAIELLRYKQFIVKHTFRNEEVLDNQFVVKANEMYRQMRPFLDYMSEILTTDANGEPLL